MPAALDFTNAYVDESASVCWKEIARNMIYYFHLFSEELLYPKFQQYVRTLFARIMSRLKWDTESSFKDADANADEGEFRKTVIYCLGLADDKEVIKDARRRFYAYIAGDPGSLSDNLRRAVFDIEVTFGNAISAKLLQELHFD